MKFVVSNIFIIRRWIKKAKRINKEYMDFVRPIKITSPISGQPVEPKIVEKIVGNKLHKEAHWIDPASGTFIRRGLVSIQDINETQK